MTKVMKTKFREPITWRLFKGLHINNSSLLNFFGLTIGGAIRILKPGRYKNLQKAWEEHKGSYSRKEWYNYFACYLIYGVLPEEYICFNYNELNDTGKREYLTEFSRHKLYDTCNDAKSLHYFENKYETYLLYKQYYNREAILVNDLTSPDDLASFISTHKRFICKPLNLWLGIGIEVIDAADFKTIDEVISIVRKKGDCIVEELIIQAPVLSRFHPKSVNTIRIPAIRTREGVCLLDPFFKTGRGESAVDNAGAGGIFAAIDKDTGIISSVGIDEKGNEYLKHPDTGMLFIGFQLPEWDKVLRLLNELMQIKPEIRYVGWDLAYKQEGWIVVEGNHEGQLLGQMTLRKGCAKEVKRVMERL